MLSQYFSQKANTFSALKRYDRFGQKFEFWQLNIAILILLAKCEFSVKYIVSEVKITKPSMLVACKWYAEKGFTLLRNFSKKRESRIIFGLTREADQTQTKNYDETFLHSRTVMVSVEKLST